MILSPFTGRPAHERNFSHHGPQGRITQGTCKADISRAERVASALALVMNLTVLQGLLLLLLPQKKGWEVKWQLLLEVGKEHPSSCFPFSYTWHQE